MPLGYLATIVATIPSWLDMVVNMDELDINPVGGQKFRPPDWKTRSELLQQFESSLKKGREVLQKTTDDRVLNHMAHHRGQLTVYLRLNDEKVPAIYGPSADEGKS